METGVIEIEFNDGRTFRIVYLNSTQKKTIINSYYDMENLVSSYKVITNGLHTTKQWRELIGNKKIKEHE